MSDALCFFPLTFALSPSKGSSFRLRPFDKLRAQPERMIYQATFEPPHGWMNK
jgi:hypothetical protein